MSTNAKDTIEACDCVEEERICLDYLKGVCKRRRWKCKFSHPPLPLQESQVTDEIRQAILKGAVKPEVVCISVGLDVSQPAIAAPTSASSTSSMSDMESEQSSVVSASEVSHHLASPTCSEAEPPALVPPLVSSALLVNSPSSLRPTSPSTPGGESFRSETPSSCGSGTPSQSADPFIRKVNGILNRLTAEKFESLSRQLLELVLFNKAQVLVAVRQTFWKAIREPLVSNLYAKLCVQLAVVDAKLFMTVQAELVQLVELMLVDLELLLGSEPTEQKRSQATLERLGSMRFFGELYLNGLVTLEDCKNVIFMLLQQASEHSDRSEACARMEMLCKLLTVMGCLFEAQEPETIAYVLQVLQQLVALGDTRIQMLFMNLWELYALQRWVSKQDSRPSTPEKSVESFSSFGKTSGHAVGAPVLATPNVASGVHVHTPYSW